MLVRTTVRLYGWLYVATYAQTQFILREGSEWPTDKECQQNPAQKGSESGSESQSQVNSYIFRYSRRDSYCADWSETKIYYDLVLEIRNIQRIL